MNLLLVESESADAVLLDKEDSTDDDDAVDDDIIGSIVCEGLSPGTLSSPAFSSPSADASLSFLDPNGYVTNDFCHQHPFHHIYPLLNQSTLLIHRVNHMVPYVMSYKC